MRATIRKRKAPLTARLVSNVLSWLVLPALVVLVPLNDPEACPLDVPGELRAQSVDLPIPRTGAQKLLVILVDFPDEPGTISQQNFSQQFFGQWPTGSFAEYYAGVSHGAISYTGDVVGVSSGTVIKNSSSIAYTRLPQPKSYYAQGVAGGAVNDFPRNLAGIYRDAIDVLAAAGMDFSPYVDGTGSIKNVVVLFAGSSSVETGNQSDLQPTAYRLAYYFNGSYRTNGFSFDQFTFCPEKALNGTSATQQASIGVCVHEHGHALGLPDLYDLSYTTAGVGYFDLMGYGVYADPSANVPVSIASPMKEELGWLNARTISPGESDTVTLAALTVGSDQAVKVLPASASTDEYFLIENRQFAGADAALANRALCSGILVWRVNRATERAYLISNLVNTRPSAGGPSSPAISIVEADNGEELVSEPVTLGECEDTWMAGARIADDTAPSTRLGSGEASGIEIQILSKIGSGAEVSYEVRVGSAVTLPPIAIATPTSTPIPSISVNVRRRTVSGWLVNFTTLVGTTVELFRSRRGAVRAYQRTASKAMGKFAFRRVAAGSYKVKAGGIESVRVRVSR